MTADTQTHDDAVKSDYDSPWKEALERFFPEFLALLFPAIHARIDWSAAPEFLDKELQQVGGDSPRGRRYADKLVRVRACDGGAIAVLIHVEVQGDPESDFGERMYERGYEQTLILELFRLIDWMIRLPKGLEADFRRELYAYEEQRRMPYVTTVEQAGIEKGLQQGEARTLLRLLDRKFGPEAAQRHRERIETAELEQLDAWLDRILTADTPETIFH